MARINRSNSHEACRQEAIVKLIIVAAAEDEVLEAAAWHEGRQTGLGEALLQELADLLQAIEERPDRFPFLETLRGHRYRRAMLNRFPYLVIYEPHPDEVLVLAFAHTARRPNYWLSRSRGR